MNPIGWISLGILMAIIAHVVNERLFPLGWMSLKAHWCDRCRRRSVVIMDSWWTCLHCGNSIRPEKPFDMAPTPMQARSRIHLVKK